MVNIKDVAKKAGVSTATVSRAFSKKGYVKEDTRQLILSIANELNFTPKVYNKKTAGSAYRSTVGVILPYLNNNFYHEIIKGIEDTLNDYDTDVLFCCTYNNPQKEIMYIDLFHHIKPTGLIIVPTSEAPDENKAYIRDISSEMDIIILDRELKGENLDGVYMNNYASAYRGTRLLISEGHDEIVFLCGSLDSTSGAERLRGYRDALSEAGIQYKSENVLYGNFDYQTAYEQTKSFISRRQTVTAIFSSSSMMSYGCMLALAEKGLSIPHNISFLTYGYSEWNDKSISFLRYPGAEMGAECARLLLEKMQSKGRRKNAPRKRSIFEVSIELNGSEKYPSDPMKNHYV